MAIMKDKAHVANKLSARQSNILPHHAVFNFGIFQGRLLKGSAATSPLQRVGKSIVGLSFLVLGGFFLAGTISDLVRHSEINGFGLFISILFAALGMSLGIKLNLEAAFPRTKDKKQRRAPRHC